VAAVTVLLDQEAVFPVVAFPAEFSGIKVSHGYLDSPVLHCGKYIRIVAVITRYPGILVRGAVEDDRAGFASFEFQERAWPDCMGDTARHKRKKNADCREVIFHEQESFHPSELTVHYHNQNPAQAHFVTKKPPFRQTLNWRL
jgi:hypothetical protein